MGAMLASEFKKAPLLGLLCIVLLGNTGVDLASILQPKSPAPALTAEIVERLEAIQDRETMLWSFAERMEKDMQRVETEVIAGRQFHQQSREADIQHAAAIGTLQRDLLRVEARAP